MGRLSQARGKLGVSEALARVPKAQPKLYHKQTRLGGGSFSNSTVERK